MDPMAVLAFGAIALALILVPGPDWAYILASGVQHRVVTPAVTGIVAGYVAITVVVVAGIGPVVASVPGILSALTLAGSLYLLYLGVRVLQSARTAAAPVPQGALDAAVPTRSSAGFLLRGFGISSLNPKGLLLFLSILPQFARPAFDWPMPAQFAALGVVYIALCSAVYFTLGWSARRFLGANPRFARITSIVAGIAMIALGLLLLGERVVEVLG